MQTTLTKKKTGKFSLKTEAGAGPRKVTEEGIVDESEPAAFSTLGYKGRSAMSQLIEAMAPLCPI